MVLAAHYYYYYYCCCCCCCYCCRHLLHRCVQAVMDSGIKLSSVLADSFSQCVEAVSQDALSTSVGDRLISLGFSLGNALVM